MFPNPTPKGIASLCGTRNFAVAVTFCNGFERRRDHMHALSGIVGIAYVLARGLAVYDRIPISEWLTSHLPV